MAKTGRKSAIEAALTDMDEDLQESMAEMADIESELGYGAFPPPPPPPRIRRHKPKGEPDH